MRVRWLIGIPLALAPLGLGGWAAMRFYQTKNPPPTASIPTAAVRRGEVTFSVTAKGELVGGNSEMLAAPMVGQGALAITELRDSGEKVEAGDVVVQFDTTEQEFKLREAEADLAEAQQQVVQAQAESAAKEEEARMTLVQARSELVIAQLETRRNELVAPMVATQNNLAVSAAQDKLQQLEKDLKDRLATARAGIAIQEAALTKAKVAAATAQRHINNMTLRAKSAGYVARQQNQDGNFRWGTYLPALQVGDTVRAGMGVAQIPDLQNWEVNARIGELDRGHLSPGQITEVRVVALPGRVFNGKLKSIGGTTGPPWDRHFETRFTIEDPAAELRPGMSARLIITTQVMKGALWLPSQALFESDGRRFVYAESGESFSPADVKLSRRSESQVVIEGLPEGRVVALANPSQMMKKQSGGPGGAMQAIPR